MEPDPVRALVRDIGALAACVRLDRESDPLRTLPVAAPRALWRILPRMLRRAASLGVLNPVERAFCLNLADDIEGRRPAPVIESGKAVAT